MLSSTFAEDIFVTFYGLVDRNTIPIQHQDFPPIVSFYTKIVEGSQLTKNQASYVLKILEKYKNLCANAGFDYRAELPNINWRNDFRVLDLSKRIYVEKSSTGKLEICLKFPYQLKKEFEEEIVMTSASYKTNYWDAEEKVRRLNFYDCNLIPLYEFANKHNFEIDDSFMSVLADVEEIWQNSEEVIPYSTISDMGVTLHNALPETVEWWEQKITESHVSDLLLAKSMGFVLKKTPTTIVEKIASSTENSFWMKNNEMLFSVVNQINGKICIVLDRASNTLAWLQNFVASADQAGVTREDIKVCFRENKDSKSGLNDWIKSAGVGGKVETGKIFIFESKPAKWLFKDNQDVTLLVTNNIYPPTNTLARDWFTSHPCVVYLGETKPTEQKGQKIVEL